MLYVLKQEWIGIYPIWIENIWMTLYALFSQFPLHVNIWIVIKEESMYRECLVSLSPRNLISRDTVYYTPLERGKRLADVEHAEPLHSPGTHCWGQADHSDHGDTWQSTGQTCQHSRFETGLWSGWQL